MVILFTYLIGFVFFMTFALNFHSGLRLACWGIAHLAVSMHELKTIYIYMYTHMSHMLMFCIFALIVIHTVYLAFRQDCCVVYTP